MEGGQYEPLRTSQGDKGGGLRHPFLLGLGTGVILCLFSLALLVLIERLNAFSGVSLGFLLGLAPIILTMNSAIVAIAVQTKYGNTRGVGLYIFGSVIVVLIYTIFLADLLLYVPPTSQ